MDRHALAARDVADDLLAADRIAAARAEHHQVVEAADLDLFLAGAEHALDGGGDRAFRRLLAQRVGRHELAPAPASAEPCRSRSPRTDRRPSARRSPASSLGERLAVERASSG